MTKKVAVADLQEHLAEHLEEVKQGVTIEVVEGDTTVAELRQPKEEEWIWDHGMRIRPAKGSMRDVKLPPPVELDFDPVDYLLEDRYGRDAIDDIIDELYKRKQ